MGLESLAFSGAQDVHDDTRDYVFTKMAQQHDFDIQQRQQGNQMALNRQMAELAGLARRQSASDAVEGLKRAGLHPAMASGVAFGSVSSGGSASSPSSAPVVGAKGTLGTLAQEAIRYNESERGLMDAQTRNLNAEAESKEIENVNRTGQNALAKESLKAFFSDVAANSSKNSAVNIWSESMLNNVDSFNYGYLDALSKYLDTFPKLKEGEQREITAKLKEVMDNLQLNKFVNEPQMRDIFASLPGEQAKAIKLANENIVANTLLLAAELGKTNKQSELIEKQKGLIDKQVQELDTLIRATHHKDLISMWEDGEYMNLAIGGAVELAPRIIQGLLQAFGIVAGGRVLKGGTSTILQNLSR